MSIDSVTAILRTSRCALCDKHLGRDGTFWRVEILGVFGRQVGLKRVRARTGAMSTARSGHVFLGELHAHAKPWAWHPTGGVIWRRIFRRVCISPKCAIASKADAVSSSNRLMPAHPAGRSSAKASSKPPEGTLYCWPTVSSSFEKSWNERSTFKESTYSSNSFLPVSKSSLVFAIR